MRIEFDDAKRQPILMERGLDFADAGQVFADHAISAPNDRKDYGELRIITVGMAEDRRVVPVCTSRGEVRRIIGIRYAHEGEAQKFSCLMG
ncbi:BrnT family toxin [Rhodanobacter sp. DHG33]|nr:BrnT family toxin [Rhodanobacter sp. DHG33]